MEWILSNGLDLITGGLVPLIIGFFSAFGGAVYSTRLAAKRREQEQDEQASGAIRDLVFAMRVAAESFDPPSEWDGTLPAFAQIVTPAKKPLADAYGKAQPYFHRLKFQQGEDEIVGNRIDDFGFNEATTAEFLDDRAKKLEAVLARGLKKN
jgi:hypothetical protein